MYTESTMPRIAKDEGPTDSLCIRLNAKETKRWTEVLRLARQRDPRATRADVIRVLYEFGDARQDLLSPQEVAFFRGRSAADQNLDPETRQREAMKRLIYAEAKTTPEPKTRRKVSGK